MNITGPGKDKHTYDAIVIGSGISGGWAAKELCEKGFGLFKNKRISADNETSLNC